MPYKKLLITSFEPFGGESVNASLLAVSALPDKIGGFEIHKLTLPVVFGRAAELAIEYAESRGVDAVLATGQAAGRAAVTPELVAVNIQYARIPDNDGNCPSDAPVIAGGREAYFSTMPIRRMAEAAAVAALCTVSYSAGAYVCNDVYYRLLHRFHGTHVRVGFIHVPVTPEQGSPSLVTADAVSALTRAIEALDM